MRFRCPRRGLVKGRSGHGRFLDLFGFCVNLYFLRSFGDVCEGHIEPRSSFVWGEFLVSGLLGHLQRQMEQ